MHAITSLLALASLVAAHGGPTSAEEVAHYQAEQQSLYHCAPVIAAYTAQRKRSWAQKVLGNSVLPGSTGIAGGADPTATPGLFLDEAFGDANIEARALEGKKILACSEAEERKIHNHSCVLSPSVTQGPYYHSEGHPIRQNMAEDQLGTLFLMDIGVIDVKTCKPVEGVLVDLWHANSTGHYAGHADPQPHLIHETPSTKGIRKGLLTAYPQWNSHETWLRAAWPTDRNGLAQFTSIFPGYYTGRATHVHARIHTKWDTLANGTFTSKHLIYTGQFFVEDNINMMVDMMYPYSTNPIAHKWGRTRNWDDSLHIYQDSHANGMQPTFDIQKLGGVFTQGHIAYMTVGVDLEASYGYGWSPEGKVL